MSLAEPRASSVRIADQNIPYLLHFDSRSRRIKIIADIEKGLLVFAPHGTPLHLIETFVSSQSDWIEKQLDRISKKREQFSSVMQPLLEKNSIKYLGKEYQLVIEVGAKHWPPVVVEDDVLVVQCVSADLAKGILERWYRKQAKAVISGAIELYREKMRVSYASLVIKDQKTRWGSCSSKGNLNFSWRLILAPKAVLDYVVVHELAHLREMNHSARFWKIVEEFYGDYKAAEKWLKDNGVGLRI